mgnify:FL=1|jgi:hypothetical protein
MTINEQIAAIRRELEYRRKLYPRWVEIKKISQKDADYQIEVMEQILCTLITVKDFIIGTTVRDEEKIKKAEKVQFSLFDVDKSGK